MARKNRPTFEFKAKLIAEVSGGRITRIRVRPLPNVLGECPSPDAVYDMLLSALSAMYAARANDDQDQQPVT